MRILIVDDHDFCRRATRQMLEARTDEEVVGEASNGLEVLELVSSLRPDLVLMDIQMPALGGVEATRIIKANFPQMRVVGFSIRHDPHIAAELSSAGGETLIRKDCVDELLSLFASVAA